MATAYVTFDLYNMDFEATRPISTGNGLHNTQQFGGRQQTKEKWNCSYFYVYNKSPIQNLALVALLSITHYLQSPPCLCYKTHFPITLIKSLPVQNSLKFPDAKSRVRFPPLSVKACQSIFQTPTSCLPHHMCFCQNGFLTYKVYAFLSLLTKPLPLTGMAFPKFTLHTRFFTVWLRYHPFHEAFLKLLKPQPHVPIHLKCG